MHCTFVRSESAQPAFQIKRYSGTLTLLVSACLQLDMTGSGPGRSSPMPEFQHTKWTQMRHSCDQFLSLLAESDLPMVRAYLLAAWMVNIHSGTL